MQAWEPAHCNWLGVHGTNFCTWGPEKGQSSRLLKRGHCCFMNHNDCVNTK